MVCSLMSAKRKPLQPDPFDYETLLTIDKRIDAAEAEGIRERWEFGRIMLAARGGKKRLPNGYLAELVERTGKSQTELSNRIRFAEAYPTEAELSIALESCESWHEIVENLYGKPTISYDDAVRITADIRRKLSDLRTGYLKLGHEIIGPPARFSQQLIDGILIVRWYGNLSHGVRRLRRDRRRSVRPPGPRDYVQPDQLRMVGRIFIRRRYRS